MNILKFLTFKHISFLPTIGITILRLAMDRHKYGLFLNLIEYS